MVGRRHGEWGLRRRLRRELAALDLPEPAGMSEVCAQLSRQRGTPIWLTPWPLEATGPFGLWLSLPQAEYILYQQATTRTHQEHIIAHEVGHLLASHESGTAAVDTDVIETMLPNLSPALVRSLGREHYNDAAEREAEDIATLLLERAEVERFLRQPARSRRAGLAQAALDDGVRWP